MSDTLPERTGNCNEQTIDKLIAMHDMTVRLVHGLPTGRGPIAAAGKYPHAWLEKDGLCWEPSIDEWLPAVIFYAMGQIEYAVVYTAREAVKMMAEHKTYGPWDEVIVARDVALITEFGV